MKKLMLLTTMLFLVTFAKAQHLEFHYDPYYNVSSPYNEIPTVWLDGDYVRYTYVVHFPGWYDSLAADYHSVFLGVGGKTYDYDLQWGLNVPRNVTTTYSGSLYVGNLSSSEYFELWYGADFLTDDNNILGCAGAVQFTYHPN
jgi:hypothetical protein